MKAKNVTSDKSKRLVVLLSILVVVSFLSYFYKKSYIPNLSNNPKLDNFNQTTVYKNAKVNEKVLVGTKTYYEVKDFWQIPANNNNSSSFLVASVYFNNQDQNKGYLYDTRYFSLEDKNGYTQELLLNKTDNRDKLLASYPQFKLLDAQKNLLFGQNAEGVIVFELNSKEKPFTILYRDGKNVIKTSLVK